MRRVSLSAHDGLALAATVWDGPASRTPILCLPGVCRSARDFLDLGARHAAKRRVVALDYAGHGESARAADPRRYQPFTLLRDVLDAMAALHVHRAAVVGTSFGGLMSMAIAAVRPMAVAAVALNDIGPEIGSTGHDNVLERLSRDVAFNSLDAATAYWREVFPPNPHLDEEGWRRFADTTFAPGGDGQWRPRWDLRIVRATVGPQPGPPPDLWALFGGLAPRPLLLIHGEVSRLLEAPTVARMRRARPDMRVVTLAGTGHAPTLTERPVMAALDAFLDGIP